MSSETTNPLHETAIYSATQQSNGYRSTLTVLTVAASTVWLLWSAAHNFLGANEVPIGVSRLTVFLAGLWFAFGAAMALINHTILTTYRVGMETVTLMAGQIVQAMQQSQAQAQAAEAAGVEPAPTSPIIYLQDAILRRAEAVLPKDQ